MLFANLKVRAAATYLLQDFHPESPLNGSWKCSIYAKVGAHWWRSIIAAKPSKLHEG